MGGSNLSVKITADIVDLQTKFAVAKAEVSGLTSEMNKLAKASAAGTIDAASQARLRQLAGDLIHARSEAGRYASEMAKAGVSVGGFMGNLERGHGSLSTATREFRALFDELTSGRTQNTPGTLAIIAQRVLGLSPAALAAVGGVGALAAGIGFLAVRAIEASHALDQMHLGALRAGNDVARSQFDQLVSQIAQLPGVSSSAARSIVSSLASVPGVTFDALIASARLAAEQMRQTGADAAKVGEQFAQALEPTRSATDLAKSIGGLTQEQVNEAIAADRSQNVHSVLAEKLRLLNFQIGRGREVTDEYTHSFGQTVERTLAWIGLTQQGMMASEVNATLKKDEADAWNANAAAIQAATSALANSPTQKPLVYDQGSVLERMREQIAQLAATWDGTQSGLLAKQRVMATRMLAEAQKDSKEYLAIQQEIARLDVQTRQAAGNEAIANARTQLATVAGDTTRSTIQRLEIERDTWQQILAGERLTAAQRVEVQRQMNSTISAIAKERQAEAQTIARSDAETDIAIARDRIEARRNLLDIDVQANLITADQKLAILKDLTNQEYALNLKALQGQFELLKAQPIEYARVYNQIRELKAKQVLDLAALDRQAAIDAIRQTRQQVSLWRGAIEEIQQSESRMIADLIGGRKTLAQAILQIGQDVLTREIQNDIKAMTTRLLLARTEEAGKKALSEGGFLYHLLFDQKKIASTVTSEAARTSAVTAGNATRVASNAAAATAAQVQAAVTGPPLVMADAAKAYAGTFASVSQIPFVGWAMAPAAAAAAFANVAAFAPLASLDVGAWNVPHDMVAQIHKGETVVPATFAEGMRQSGMFGDAASKGIGNASRPLNLRVTASGRNHVLVEKRELASLVKLLNNRFAFTS